MRVIKEDGNTSAGSGNKEDQNYKIKQEIKATHEKKKNFLIKSDGIFDNFILKLSALYFALYIINDAEFDALICVQLIRKISFKM